MCDIDAKFFFEAGERIDVEGRRARAGRVLVERNERGEHASRARTGQTIPHSRQGDDHGRANVRGVSISTADACPSIRADVSNWQVIGCFHLHLSAVSSASRSATFTFLAHTVLHGQMK
ncbi:hypothetical protein [Burkholderia contaminans]|uniref:hypothetical protein n=1 Tax=Burkholderia contaminans TaxID=488447 RepID=UPI001582F0A4|nr:hypothetical protein [Burkholderia contaminans]